MAITETRTVCPVPCATVRLAGLTVSENPGVLALLEPVLDANILPPQPDANPAAKTARERSQKYSLRGDENLKCATFWGRQYVTATSGMLKSGTRRDGCTHPEVTQFLSAVKIAESANALRCVGPV